MKINFSLKELNKIIEEHFIPRIEKYKIFTFKGPLGAGKTTTIKNILRFCGVDELITSPSFSYLNSYKTSSGKIFHHFDLYRLDSLDSFLSLGFDEYLNDENSICFIEWPEIIEPLLKDSNLNKYVCTVTLGFDIKNNEKRFLELS